ncbi:MAG: SurA N-terminal domain-containing protein, partial [Anaerococcus sp.]
MNLAKILQKIIIISLILPIATSCQKKLNRTDNVAIVDDEYVTKDLYSKELTFYTSYYTKKYGDNYLNEKNKDGQTNYETLEKNLLDSLIMDQVMLNDLKNENYKMNDVEYENLHKGLVENLKNEESLYANIEAINSDELSFSDALFRDSIKFEHKKMFKKNGSIKDEDVL